MINFIKIYFLPLSLFLILIVSLGGIISIIYAGRAEIATISYDGKMSELERTVKKSKIITRDDGLKCLIGRIGSQGYMSCDWSNYK